MKYLFSVLLLLIVSVGIVSAASTAPRTLKLVNNNVYLYQGNKKIDTLTTRGNAMIDGEVCKAWLSHPSVDTPCVLYKVINGNKFSLIVKYWWIPDTDARGVNIFLYNFQKNKSRLIDITRNLLGTTDFSVTNIVRNDSNISVSVSVNAEMGPSPDFVKKLGFNLGENTGTQDLPVYKNATKVYPDSFFLKLLK